MIRAQAIIRNKDIEVVKYTGDGFVRFQIQILLPGLMTGLNPTGWTQRTWDRAYHSGLEAEYFERGLMGKTPQLLADWLDKNGPLPKITFKDVLRGRAEV